MSETTPQTCPAVGYQSASICVPVTVTPFANTGTTSTKCCGGPVVTSGRNICGGTKNGSCAFTISQDICVAVPVAFGATANVGDMYVNCNGASSDDICTNCDEEPIYMDNTTASTTGTTTSTDSASTLA